MLVKLLLIFSICFSTALGFKIFDSNLFGESALTASPSAIIAPLECIKISNYFNVSTNFFSLSIALTIQSSKIDGKGYITIENFVINSSYFNIKNICVYTDSDEAHCIYDFSKSLLLNIENTTFSIVVNVKENNLEFPLYNGLIDEGSFSYFTGELFSDANKCFSTSDSDGGTNGNTTQCCIRLIPAPIAPINSPKCLKFKSRTTVYNIDDNYSIFFTSKINYTITDKNITSHGELTGPKDYIVVYVLNDGYICETTEVSTFVCNFPIPNGDSKLLLQMEALNKTEDYEPLLLVGRILIRNGQTLMEEGIPFTKENDCQYFNRQYSKNKVATTSFCCTDFQQP